MDEQIEKMQGVCIYHNGILLSHKVEESPLFVATWLGPEDITLSEISQTEKGRYCVISLTVESENLNAQRRTD